MTLFGRQALKVTPNTTAYHHCQNASVHETATLKYDAHLNGPQSMIFHIAVTKVFAEIHSGLDNVLTTGGVITTPFLVYIVFYRR